MEYRRLGTTDLNVSALCLGTMTWGKQNNRDDGFAQMDMALDHGINFFDTAEMYAVPATPDTYGKTEEIIGEWFRKNNMGEWHIHRFFDTLQSELSRFLSEPEFRLIKMNDSTSKRYTDLYRAFKKAYVRERGAIDAAEQKFLEHFYEPDLIDHHLRRTSARSKTTR